MPREVGCCRGLPSDTGEKLTGMTISGRPTTFPIEISFVGGPMKASMPFPLKKACICCISTVRALLACNQINTIMSMLSVMRKWLFNMHLGHDVGCVSFHSCIQRATMGLQPITAATPVSALCWSDSCRLCMSLTCRTCHSRRHDECLPKQHCKPMHHRRA